MLDPVSLAVIAAGILPKALPYLIKLGGAMGDSLAEKARIDFGPEAWDTAKSIWSKIGDRLLNRPAGQIAVDDIIKAPEDGDNVASLRKEVRKVLEEDPALTADLDSVIKDRIKVDMTLQNVVRSEVTGIDLEGEFPNIDLKMKMGDVTDSKIRGIVIKKIG
ncbi:MAG: hypothetical protein LUQ37_03615 [Methanoregulaceae archaeon]|jgi:hypothetical protein|nr:hypothetical protein [Methanoregulaceae archaeon]